MGIGASAGGLEALRELFSKTPVSTGMAFVVVTHQHAGYASLLPELLAKTVRMPVVEMEDGMPLQPNRIHVSGTLASQLGDRFRLEGRGLVELKGKGAVETCYLVGRRDS